ncbi:5-methylthioadenosine/S-adenosylhomocysteine deaminase-like [Ylistrum balloti]|uniref:5-methylthioadenosine/S-adenosylhomocysteine deaminase-like n=1 Tax=Ylistrum balloti TaxID=509963 RepID=UPI002905C06C|nr:5-methylthioadenosine/S-adenosylhomocysteine deaminase-like [Ylistrum balloti]
MGKSLNNPLDFKNCIAYPGLFNAHDHLLGTYLPRVGRGPYLSWKPWDDDLKTSDLYQERSMLTNAHIYQISYYRQILSGVTTVCDHIPHIVHKDFLGGSFVRIIKEYCLAHEISSYELKWGDDHKVEIERAKKKNIPFITHLEEGFDEESKQGTEILHRKKGIFKNSVLVHCVSCSLEDIKLIAKQKASMVWCPNSNYYMFNQTAKIKDFIEQGVNVCLGTDSPMSGSVNLFAELQFAQKTYQKLYGSKISPKLLFKMITINPAKAFRLDQQLGTIEEGKLADILILKKSKEVDPYKKVVNANTEDIEMLWKEGVPLYFKEEYYSKLPKAILQNYEKVCLESKGGKITAYLIGKPHLLKKKINESVNFKKELEFIPII